MSSRRKAKIHSRHIANEAEFWPYSEVLRLVSNKTRDPWAITAKVSITLGLIAPLAGLALDIVPLIVRLDQLNLPFATIKLVMYLASIPLLLLGAHCLDVIERHESTDNYWEAIKFERPSSRMRNGNSQLRHDKY